MEHFNPYLGVIAICIIVIFSYNFNIISRYTNIPSVLLLIGLGIAIRQGLQALQIEVGENLVHLLEMVGIVGLIMIVLEAALELELSREKISLILRSFFIAFFGLFLTSFLTAYIIYRFIVADLYTAMLYAVPLSILSSAIIIPSVARLMKSKREFLVYESAFSDILGIMFFYFLLSEAGKSSIGGIVLNVSLNILSTVVLAVVVSYFLVWLLQRINSQVKMILLISVLVMLYAIAKMLHLSSLIIILIFGLVLNNYSHFFRWKLRSWIREERLKPVLEDFHLITTEAAFFIRTFFFVLFGISLELIDLVDLNAALISLGIVGSIILVRFICLKLFRVKNMVTELFVAPRGLITILLFFSIPAAKQFAGFSPGILLYTILITSVIMAVVLVVKGKETERFEVLEFDDWDELDKEIAELKNAGPAG
ncbi:MAG: sodium:proton exchanger [Bacteroides sp. SM23_62]|nr:MAG: sodium:proton exchanger [Bacteroides sp. SM23_62]